MKPARAVVAGAVLIMAAAACRSTAPLDVHTSLPGVSPFAPGTFSTIVVTRFRDDAPPPDFAPGPAFEEVLANGLRRELKNTGGLVDRDSDEALARVADPAAWKAAGEGKSPGAAFLVGSVLLSAKTLKAIDKKALSDGPFDLVRRLIAKRRWTLEAEISVVSAATGETLYHETFRESQDYGELDKTAEFAFSELADRILGRVSQALLGRPTIEVRTLFQR
jgi:hypothetical protein